MGTLSRFDLERMATNGEPTCLGGGYVALDIVAGRHGSFAAAGGSCGNIVMMLAWLGWKTSLAARIGRDAAGNRIATECSAVGIRNEYLFRDEAISTPIVLQNFVADTSGTRTHRFSLTCPHCGRWLPRFRALTVKQANIVIGDMAAPAVFHFDRVAPATLKLAGWARDKGALIVFEPSSLGNKRVFQRALDICHILKFSQDRIRYGSDLEIVEGPSIVIETMGKEGLRVRWRSRWSVLPAFRVLHMLDAAGSGDWCTAGLIHMIGRRGAGGLRNLRKSELDSALTFAQGLAAINCAFEGARGAMISLSLAEMNRALAGLLRNAGELNYVPESMPQSVFHMSEAWCNSCTGTEHHL